MYEIRKMFQTAWVRENVIPAKEYHPYPKPEERGFWENLAPELKKTLLEEGKEYLSFEWKGLPATYFLEFQRSGDRTCYEDLSFQKRTALRALVMAECVENENRFLDDIINGIWSICEESTWAISAHLGNCSSGSADVLPDSLNDAVLDLFSLETAQLSAFVYYLLKNKLDTISPQIAKRIQGELKRRVFTPYLTGTEFWWMGFMGGQVNNWAPWCTSNVLWTFAMACENDNYRAAAVNKAIETLDIFVNSYGEDGACVEGPGYWFRAAASLMDALEVISNVTGNQIPLQSEKIKQMGRFICNARIHDKYYMNFADSPLRIVPDPTRIFCYGKTMQDSMMMAEGAAIKRVWGEPVHYSGYCMGRIFAEILCYDEMKQYTGKPLCQQDVWWSDAQIMIARETEKSAKGYILIAKGGHNGESHNHNDIGSFMLYDNGKPIIIDIGVERYTKKTFSPQRYEIWTMRSGYHNVPQIGGAEQLPGEEYGAQQVDYTVEQGTSSLKMELGDTYGTEAGIRSWNRTLCLDRGAACVQICDCYDLEQEQEIAFHFMTLEKPEISGTEVKIGTSILQINGAQAAVAAEKIDVTDSHLQKSWGDTLYRVTVLTKGQKGEVCFEIKR